MHFRNKFIDKIYVYLYINDGQNILEYEMSEQLQISRPTIRKYIRWLEKRGIIKKDGKRITILEF